MAATRKGDARGKSERSMTDALTSPAATPTPDVSPQERGEKSERRVSSFPTRSKGDVQSSGLRDDAPPFGVYVHWPFCAQKCPYCDFNSHVRFGGWDEARFLAAYIREIDATVPDPSPNCPRCSAVLR